MINRKCLVWDLWNCTAAFIFRSNLGDVYIMIPGKLEAVSTGWKTVFEIGSHRKSLGNNEKKTLNFWLCYWKTEQTSFSIATLSLMQKCLQIAVSTMLVISEYLGDRFTFIMLRLSPKEVYDEGLRFNFIL